jgi:hypothetical protein
MNGNVTKEGIAKDLEWMKRIGIGGVQTFDASMQTPQIVEHRLAYMSPEWKDAFRYAAQEADRHGLELAIASSPGWSETGGPWVPPADGLKKLVWSLTEIEGGRQFSGTLSSPPTVTGAFQNMKRRADIAASSVELTDDHGDIGVFAFPQNREMAVHAAKATNLTGLSLDPKALTDDDLESGPQISGDQTQLAAVELGYTQPFEARSATLYIPEVMAPLGGALYSAELQSSEDGKKWSIIAPIELTTVPTSISFTPVQAAHFRVLLRPQSAKNALGKPVAGAALAGMLDEMNGAAAKRPLVVGTFRVGSVPMIDRFETKAGFVMSADYYALRGPGDGAVGIDPAKVIDLSTHVTGNGELNWKAPNLPAGQTWRVIRMGYSLLGTTNHPASPEATGLEVDKFDADAVSRYLEHYLDMYKDATGANMIGKQGIRALLTDSIEVGEANWTPRMLDQFQRLRGYDPRPWLPTLAGVLVGTREGSDKFLYDYRRTLADLLASEHYGTIARIAHENGLVVYGEALEDRRPMLGDDMAMRSHADVPMAAMWTFQKDEGPRQTLIADMKGAASVAHLYGQNLVAAESLTSAVAPWAFAPKDLKRFIDMEFINGVNRPVIHTSVHVPRDDKKPGLSLYVFGQHFNRMESWGEMARPWVDYIARSSVLLQAGRNVADIAYFYGEEAPLTALFGDKPVADSPVTHAYDFLNFDALNDLLKNDGGDLVAPSGARYRAIYLGGSSQRMTLAALRKLAALVEGGATVIGKAPVATPSFDAKAQSAEWSALVAKLWPGRGNAKVGAGRVIASDDVEAALKSSGVSSDFRFTGAEPGAKIPFLHRRDGQREIYYLSNQQETAQTIEARFRVTGKVPRLWHPETGESEPVSYRIDGAETSIPLSLIAGDAVFVVFDKPAPAASLTVPIKPKVAVASLDDSWTIRFQADRGAPAMAQMARLSPLEQNANPAIKYFSGEATYTRSFALPPVAKLGQPLWLDLGAVGDLAQVTVNGRIAGSVWHAPYRIDIGKTVRKGVNTIEVKVANLWVNRLIGDAQPGARPITWTAMPTYRADAPLRPAGLIGPVTLQVEK